MHSPSTNTTGITASASMDFPHGNDYHAIIQKLQKQSVLILRDLLTEYLFFETVQAAQNIKIRR